MIGIGIDGIDAGKSKAIHHDREKLEKGKVAKLKVRSRCHLSVSPLSIHMSKFQTFVAS
jgi:hypothetical protein